MIRVHAYCSYKLSPSGFQYGTFDITDDVNEGMYYLSDDNKDAIVSSAFDYSIVKRLKGKIPNKSTFVFLFKKISYTYDSEHDDVGGDVSLNMAFEFDDYKQFALFSNGFESYEKNDPLELARILADCIAPDISITKYKLSIHKKNIDDWLKLMIVNQQNIETDLSRLQWQLGIITDSNEKNLYSNDLQEIFNFDTINENGDEFGIKHLEGAMYIYPAKKKEKFLKNQLLQQGVKHNLFLKILVVALIVGLVVILMIAIIPKNNKSNAMEINQYVPQSDDSSIVAPIMAIETNTVSMSYSKLSALYVGSV